jgi:Flp pilus assembly protein TadB
MRGANLFEKACALAVRIWPIDAARVQGRRRAILERVRSLDSEIEEIEQSVQFEPKVDRERDDQARRLQRLRRQRDRDKAVLEQRSFHQALEVTRLNVTLETVLRLGRIAALTVAAFCVVVLLGALASGLPTSVILVLGVFVLVSPVAAYVLVLSYPEGLARRMRVASLGGAPEAVNYMAMSMRVVPSLDRAIEFAAHHTEEPLASRLRQVLWSVYLRSPPGLEAAFLRFAAEWGERQEDVKRALFALASASLEQTDAGLDRTLEKARQIAFEGTRARIMEYSAGLRGPTTVLFALGVLLPVIIGAMLPLVSLGGLTPSLAGSPGPSQGADVTVPAVLAMDVLFPLGAFAYAYRILGSRPGTGSALDFGRPAERRHLLVSIALLIAAIPAFVLASSPLVSFVGLWLVVAAGVVYLVPGLRDFERRRRAIAKLEAEFPDALFILGSRIAEGAPAERALQMTADTTRGSEVSALLGRILRALQTSRQGLEEVLFSRSGVLRDVPSRTVHAAFRMVVEVSRKDPASAGKTIVETSAYLRDLRAVDREIHRDLSSVVDAMQTTGAFFAPIVLGVTCALYGLLTRAFSSIVVLGLSPVTFLGVVGVYLLLAVAVITYFRVGIAHGRDPIEVRAQLARAWPVSMAVFTAAFLVSELGLS